MRSPAEIDTKITWVEPGDFIRRCRRDRKSLKHDISLARFPGEPRAHLFPRSTIVSSGAEVIRTQHEQSFAIARCYQLFRSAPWWPFRYRLQQMLEQRDTKNFEPSSYTVVCFPWASQSSVEKEPQMSWRISHFWVPDLGGTRS